MIKTPAKAVIGITKNHPRTFTGKGDIGEGVSFPASICYEQSTGGSGILHISGTVAVNSQSSNFTFIRISKINTVLGLTFAVNPAVKIGSWAEPSGTVDTGYGACCEISSADGGCIMIGRIYTTGGDYGAWPASILSGKTFSISIPMTEVTQSTPRIYWDVPPERIRTQPVVNIAENEGGGFEFTLTNDYEDPTGNVLSEMFGLWNDASTGPLRPGMFVALSHDTWQNRVTEGRISEIIAGDRTVTVRVADFNSLMGTQGQTLFRNYHGGYVSNKYHKGAWNAGTSKLEVLNIPALSTVPASAVLWGVGDKRTYSSRGYTNRFFYLRPEYTKLNDSNGPIITEAVYSSTADPDFSVVKQINLRYRYKGTIIVGQNYMSYGFKVHTSISDGTKTANQYEDVSMTGTTDYTVKNLTFNNLDMSGSLTITIRVYDFWSEARVSCSLDVELFNVPNATTWEIDRNVSGSIANYEEGITDYRNVTGSLSGTKYVIDSVSGLTSIDPNLHFIPFLADKHAKASYTTGTVMLSSVLESMANGIGYSPDDGSTGDITLKEFRVGGGYLLDYMKALCDLSPDGDANACRSFRAYGEPGAVPVLKVADRSKVPTLPDYNAMYGNLGNSSDMRILRHSPAQTIIERPSQIIARTKTALGDDPVPLIITMTDWDTEGVRNLGTVKYSEGEEMSSVGDTVRKAWASFRANNVWEGMVTVSGVYPNLISDAGRGITMSLTDPRYAMEDLKVLVKSIRLDYGQQTTEITYGNLGPEYGNKLKDGSAMALFSAHRVADASSANALYATQYVRIVSQAPIRLTKAPGSVNRTINISGVFILVTVSLYELDSLNVTLTTSSFTFLGWTSAPAWITTDDGTMSFHGESAPQGDYQVKFSGKNIFGVTSEYTINLNVKDNPPIVNKMRVPDAETVDSGVVEISDDRLNIILYPDNKRALVCLTVQATNNYYTSSPNAIASVIFNGVSHLIPEDLRPDLYKGQTLIVNLDVPIDN